MRRFPVTLLILVAAVVAAVGGWMLFAKSEHDRYVAVDRVQPLALRVPSLVHLQHTSGPIAREVWSMQNIDGRSTASYTAVDRHGTKATFDEQIVRLRRDVPVPAAGRRRHLGAWSRARSAGRRKRCTWSQISQVADKASGSHRFQFSDAHYIATEAGREYHIHLDPHKPVPDLVNLQSTSTADPRYEKIAEGLRSVRLAALQGARWPRPGPSC